MDQYFTLIKPTLQNLI